MVTTEATGVRALIFAVCGVGYTFGSLTLTVLAFVQLHGATYQAPLAMAFFSGAGVAGGIWYGTRATPRDVPKRFFLFTLIFGLGVLLISGSITIVTLCAFLIVPGAAVPPTMSTVQLLADEASDPSVHTETRAWIATALSSGVATGSAVSGAVITYGNWRFALVAASVIVLLAGAVIIVIMLSRRHFTPARAA